MFTLMCYLMHLLGYTKWLILDNYQRCLVSLRSNWLRPIAIVNWQPIFVETYKCAEYWSVVAERIRAPNSNCGVSDQHCMRVSLSSRNFDDRLSWNFPRFVILWCWDTPSEKTGLWQLPLVSTVFNMAYLYSLNVKEWKCTLWRANMRDNSFSSGLPLF